MASSGEKDMELGTLGLNWSDIKWRDVNISSSRFKWPRSMAKTHRLLLFLLATIAFVLFFRTAFYFSSREVILPPSEHYLQWGAFESMNLPGFVNSGVLGQRSCDVLSYNTTVGVQKSSHLYDNLQELALAMDSRPEVKYSDSTMSNPDFTVSDIVDRAWSRMSGSSVWLADQGVFLVVTRVLFLGERELLYAPKASYLRGQIFNENWEHLEDYNIHWQGKNITFPTVFDIPTEYEGGSGLCYGPEDPRIVIEEGIKGAEPVILFNMAHKRTDWKRAMYLFRPFSNHTKVLTIGELERPDKEKNWAPFFLPSTNVADRHSPPQPNEYVHFVYSFKPLKIIKCHLRCGDCEVVFEQKLPETYQLRHGEEGGTISGGTNFVSLPTPKHLGVHPEVRAHVAFPRTHVEKVCHGIKQPFYRPEFIVMVSFRGQFHLAFASKALDFGDAFIAKKPDDDACDVGRILIPNSICEWNTKEDVMTITCSVDDRTSQVARLHGLLAFVRGLPQFKNALSKHGPLKDTDSELANALSSWVGDDVRACAVESAINYTFADDQTHDSSASSAHADPNDQKDPSMFLTVKAGAEAAKADG